MISRTIFRLVRAPTALSRMRIDLTVRPCLPITRPKSSFATRNWSTDAVSLLVSLTSTASGLLTNYCAKNWTSSFMAGSVEGVGAVVAALIWPVRSSLRWFPTFRLRACRRAYSNVACSLRALFEQPTIFR